MPTKPKPPKPPPCRIFKQTFFSGFAETKESKQATRDWENYIRGYSEGLGGAIKLNISEEHRKAKGDN